MATCIAFAQETLLKNWSTYYWCNDTDKVLHKVDFEGNIIVATTLGNLRAPYTYYSQFTTAGAHRSLPNSTTIEHSEIVISKFSKTGQLLWATYFGGNSIEVLFDFKIDNFGNSYLTGRTNTSSVITPGGSITTSNTYYPNYIWISASSGFLAKFSPTGQLLWCTYLQGIGQSVVIENNKIHVSGYTKNVSLTIPQSFLVSTPGCVFCTPDAYIDTTPLPNNPNNDMNGFYLRFNTDGQREYGTYLGRLPDVKMAVSGNDVYFYGSLSQYQGTYFSLNTISSQTQFGGGNYDGYVMKFNTQTNQMVWRSFYGGEEDDFITTGVVAKGDLYLGGQTSSTTNIATTQSMQPNLSLTTAGQKSVDWFLTKINSTGTRAFATYFGGNGNEENIDVQLYNNSLFFTGSTKSAGLANATIHQENYENFAYNTIELGSSLFGVFNLDGTKQWSSYYNKVTATSISVDAENSIYVAGKTTSDTGVSTANGWQPMLNTYIPPGSTSPTRFNLFVTKFVPESLSVDEIKNTDISIFPNPSTGTIHIQSKNKISKVEILDALGRFVIENNTFYYQDEMVISIKHNLNKGMYLVVIYNDLNNIITKKLIVK